jgi:DNA-directed RNA polymerase specialized sigma24 family protein
VRAGDDAAFEIIYDRYYRGLLAFCGHMLEQPRGGGRPAAGFASAYQSAARRRATSTCAPWLYTIARNRCLSVLRAQRRRLPPP